MIDLFDHERKHKILIHAYITRNNLNQIRKSTLITLNLQLMNKLMM